MLNLDIAFLVGTTKSCQNPPGFPERLPFCLGMDRETGVFEHIPSPDVQTLVNEAYTYGSLVGIAMDDSALGSKYAYDFLKFVSDNTGDVNADKILEIGCGRGYLLKLLRDKGASCTGLEPGPQNKKYWENYQLTVFNDSFPSILINSRFDLIIGFCIMEHIEDLTAFFRDIRKHLFETGSLIIAVPNCEEYISNGDVGMFLHQHYHYFTATTLANVILKNGFSPRAIQSSGFGGLIYAHCEPCGKREVFNTIPSRNLLEEEFNNFESKYHKNKAIINRLVRDTDDVLGIYCPGRLLNFLDPDVKNLRFFDDDPELHHKYYPSYGFQIENLQELLADSPKKILICSRAFGHEIKNSLIKNGIPECNVVLLKALLAT
jgi:SAM-dependent methyltransferase